MKFSIHTGCNGAGLRGPVLRPGPDFIVVDEPSLVESGEICQPTTKGKGSNLGGATSSAGMAPARRACGDALAYGVSTARLATKRASRGPITRTTRKRTTWSDITKGTS